MKNSDEEQSTNINKCDLGEKSNEEGECIMYMAL